MNSAGADPDLVETWVRGWAIARSVGPPVRDRGGFRVEVGLPDQRRRFVLPAIVPGLRDLAHGIDESWVFLKICAPDAEVQPALPPRWTIQAAAFMMVRPLQAAPAATLPVSYLVACAVAPPMLTATVIAGDGRTAASGSVAFVKDHAIFGRIVTHDDHRRRGLGRAVMATLGRLAHHHGARHGVLVATPAGRARYTALGWSVHTPYTSAVILPAG